MYALEDEVVKFILRQTRGGLLEWFISPRGGFATRKLDPVHLHIIGATSSYTTLTITDGHGQEYRIKEPDPHISEAPGGKFVSAVKKFVGHPPVLGPQNQEGIDKESLRKNLVSLRETIWERTKYKRENDYVTKGLREVLQHMQRIDRH